MSFNIESLENAEQNRRKDEDYNKKPEDGFERAKADKFGLPYGEFNPYNKVENNNNQEKDKYGKYIHLIINQLSKSGKTLKEIKEIVENPDEPENLIIMEKTLDKVKESLGDTNNNFNNFKSDINEISQIDGLKSFDFTIENNNFHSEVLNMIGKNYLKFEDKDGNFNIELDLQNAILTTQIEILEKYTNIPRDTQTYKSAIHNINSGIIEDQMEAIETLYYLGASKSGELGKTTLDKFIKKRKTKLNEKYKKLKKELEILDNNDNLTAEEEKKKEELENQLEKVIDEAIEIDKGEVFTGGDLDKSKGEINIEKTTD